MGKVLILPQAAPRPTPPTYYPGDLVTVTPNLKLPEQNHAVVLKQPPKSEGVMVQLGPQKMICHPSSLTPANPKDWYGYTYTIGAGHHLEASASALARSAIIHHVGVMTLRAKLNPAKDFMTHGPSSWAVLNHGVERRGWFRYSLYLHKEEGNYCSGPVNHHELAEFSHIPPKGEQHVTLAVAHEGSLELANCSYPLYIAQLGNLYATRHAGQFCDADVYDLYEPGEDGAHYVATATVFEEPVGAGGYKRTAKEGEVVLTSRNTTSP